MEGTLGEVGRVLGWSVEWEEKLPSCAGPDGGVEPRGEEEEGNSGWVLFG